MSTMDRYQAMKAAADGFNTASRERGTSVSVYVHGGWRDDDPAKAGVSWSSIGTVDADTAAMYAERIIEAAALARELNIEAVSA